MPVRAVHTESERDPCADLVLSFDPHLLLSTMNVEVAIETTEEFRYNAQLRQYSPRELKAIQRGGRTDGILTFGVNLSRKIDGKFYK